MVAGLNLSCQGIKRKAVYTEGAGPVCKCTGQCTLPFFNPCTCSICISLLPYALILAFPHVGKFMHLIRQSNFEISCNT